MFEAARKRLTSPQRELWTECVEGFVHSLRCGLVSSLLPRTGVGLRAWLVTASACVSGWFAHADELTLRTDSGVGVVRVEGRIVDLTGGQVSIETDIGVRNFDADRVVEIVTARTGPHREALAAIAGGRFEAALDDLGAALDDEPRAWVRRQILAETVRTHAALGDRVAAGEAFLAILESDPESRFYELIPLPWSLEPASSAERNAARRWVEGPGDAARLLGAAVLVGDRDERRRATTVLDRLAVSLDERFYHLARAQLWRGRLFEDRPAMPELAQWERRIGDTPGALRGGPYHLLGLASASLGQLDRAVAAHLQAATVYPGDVRRAAEDRRLAAEHLRRLGREGEAAAIEAETPQKPEA